MRLQVKGRNLEVSEQIRKYAEDKLGKLDRLVSDPTRVELELQLSRSSTRSRTFTVFSSSHGPPPFLSKTRTWISAKLAGNSVLATFWREASATDRARCASSAVD